MNDVFTQEHLSYNSRDVCDTAVSLTDEDCPGLLFLVAEIFSLQSVEHGLAGL